MCLRLVCTHLKLAITGCLSSFVLGDASKVLRSLLFRLIDQDSPDEIKNVSLENVLSTSPELFFQIHHSTNLIFAYFILLRNILISLDFIFLLFFAVTV